MTDEMYCNICEDYIAPKPVYDEDKDAFVGEEGIPCETLGDALNEIDELGLWNEEWNTFVCMGCITLSYEVANGAPIRKRIRMTVAGWRWRWYRWRHKK